VRLSTVTRYLTTLIFTWGMSFIFKVNSATRKRYFVAFSKSRRDSNGPGHILRRRCLRKVSCELHSMHYSRWRQAPPNWITCR